MGVSSCSTTINKGLAISGTIGRGATVGATISAMSYQTYSGPYEVVPKDYSLTLATKNLRMSDDVNVKAIPTYRVANAFGGDTFTIGELNG